MPNKYRTRLAYSGPRLFLLVPPVWWTVIAHKRSMRTRVTRRLFSTKFKVDDFSFESSWQVLFRLQTDFFCAFLGSRPDWTSWTIWMFALPISVVRSNDQYELYNPYAWWVSTGGHIKVIWAHASRMIPSWLAFPLKIWELFGELCKCFKKRIVHFNDNLVTTFSSVCR